MNASTVIRSAVFSVLFSAIASCDGGNSSSGPDPTPVVVVETQTTDLFDYVSNSLIYVQAYSEAYAVPTASELNRFDSVIIGLMNQDLKAVQASAGDIGFRLLRIIDSGANNNEVYCLEELVLRGQGFYCLDYDSSNSHHVSVPHPLFDSHTNTESVTVMRAIGARFFSLSSTHRCANAVTSACSGTTSVCGTPGPYKISDVAHNVDSFFFHFGKIVHDRSFSTHTMQLHGCGSTACQSNKDDADIVARLSAGTTGNLPATEFVNVLNTDLNEELAPLHLGSSLSCSEPSPDKRLCGTTNTLGRYINGQSDPCQNGASGFESSRWLHVEQNANIRQDDGAGDSVTPATLAKALNDSFDRP